MYSLVLLTALTAPDTYCNNRVQLAVPYTPTVNVRLFVPASYSFRVTTPACGCPQPTPNPAPFQPPPPAPKAEVIPAPQVADPSTVEVCQQPAAVAYGSYGVRVVRFNNYHVGFHSPTVFLVNQHRVARVRFANHGAVGAIVAQAGAVNVRVVGNGKVKVIAKNGRAKAAVVAVKAPDTRVKLKAK